MQPISIPTLYLCAMRSSRQSPIVRYLTYLTPSFLEGPARGTQRETHRQQTERRREGERERREETTRTGEAKGEDARVQGTHRRRKTRERAEP